MCILGCNCQTQARISELRDQTAAGGSPPRRPDTSQDRLSTNPLRPPALLLKGPADLSGAAVAGRAEEINIPSTHTHSPPLSVNTGPQTLSQPPAHRPPEQGIVSGTHLIPSDSIADHTMHTSDRQPQPRGSVTAAEPPTSGLQPLRRTPGCPGQSAPAHLRSPRALPRGLPDTGPGPAAGLQPGAAQTPAGRTSPPAPDTHSQRSLAASPARAPGRRSRGRASSPRPAFPGPGAPHARAHPPRPGPHPLSSSSSSRDCVRSELQCRHHMAAAAGAGRAGRAGPGPTPDRPRPACPPRDRLGSPGPAPQVPPLRPQSSPRPAEPAPPPPARRSARPGRRNAAGAREGRRGGEAVGEKSGAGPRGGEAARRGAGPFSGAGPRGEVRGGARGAGRGRGRRTRPSRRGRGRSPLSGGGAAGRGEAAWAGDERDPLRGREPEQGGRIHPPCIPRPSHGPSWEDYSKTEPPRRHMSLLSV